MSPAAWSKFAPLLLLAASAVLFAASFALRFSSPDSPLGGSGLLPDLAHMDPGGSSSGSGNGTRFLISNFGLPGPVPWEWIRDSVQQQFTLGGRVQVVSYFLDKDAPDSGAKPFEWSNEGIEQQVAMTRRRDANFGSYKPKDTAAFFSAFDKYPLRNKSVLVVGSQWPWVEAICLGFDADAITTVDFNRPVASHPKLRQLVVGELEGSSEMWDVAVSYSSLEHDGLGRYGDPINPYGDLQRMQKIKGLLRPGGLLFLGVPVGNDTLVYNAHRIYGPLRMPLLLAGWRLLDVFGVSSLEDLYKENFTIDVVQPVLVLAVDDKAGGDV
ncbi:hypothetical protein CLOM_g7737 [Closterium sp. NIES-68]|nr:hypothetical protein CLOM_g7737 [Closterium sp. NIES-68]GJP63004.1 hypothetical protein CLOP_g20057 [Closterium sp. NIES-67]